MTDWRVFTTSWLDGALLADLPFDSLQFSKQVNAAGRCQLKLQANDPRLQNLDLVRATQRGQACLWVMYGPDIVWGGIITSRTYTRSPGWLEITANTFSWYFAKRWQAQDYTYTWMAPADPMAIASTVVSDALVLQGSLLDYNSEAGQGVPTTFQQFGSTPLINWVTMSYPSIQLQTVSMIVSTLTQMGYTVGFDYLDHAWLDGDTPSYTWQMGNPFIGRTPQVSGLVIDIAQTIDLTVTEDSTKQANSLVEMSTASGSVMVFSQWPPAQIDYPLYQKIEMHPDVNSTPDVQVTLDAMAQSDLVLTAYGGDTMSVTMPVEGQSLQLQDFGTGDGVLVQYFPSAEPYKTPDPRFPLGYQGEWRIVHTSVTVPTHGVPTMKLTLNVLPQQTPQPSGLSLGGVPSLRS